MLEDQEQVEYCKGIHEEAVATTEKKVVHCQLVWDTISIL